MCRKERMKDFKEIEKSILDIEQLPEGFSDLSDPKQRMMLAAGYRSEGAYQRDMDAIPWVLKRRKEKLKERE